MPFYKFWNWLLLSELNLLPGHTHLLLQLTRVVYILRVCRVFFLLQLFQQLYN
jgi:hypothetical protein